MMTEAHRSIESAERQSVRIKKDARIVQAIAIGINPKMLWSFL
jgi:hypothetical protein